MSKLTKSAPRALVPSLATCGGDLGPMFLVAKSLTESKSEDLRDIIPSLLLPIAEASILKLEMEAKNGVIDSSSVLRRYGLPKHFHEMNQEAQLGMDSVAREIPPEIRAVAHTMLPLTNGVYTNEGRIISFKGLVPLGPQTGNLVVHLGGIFSSHCSRSEINDLLAEQAKDIDFLKAADRVGTIDYEGTQLQRATIRAKEALGL